MARLLINIGAIPNDLTGDPLRVAFDKINKNFEELYAPDPEQDLLTADELAAIQSSSLPSAANPFVTTNQIADFVTDAELTTALASYVTDAELTTALASYVTDADLTTTLAGYVTDSELSTTLSTTLADYVTNASLATTLAGYVTDSELSTTLSAYATDAEVSTAIANFITLADLDGDKGDITVSGSGAAYTIDNDVVTFSKMQNIATGNILGNFSGLTGDIELITPATLTAQLPTFTSLAKGLVPSSAGAGPTEFLSADGTWVTPDPGIVSASNGLSKSGDAVILGGSPITQNVNVFLSSAEFTILNPNGVTPEIFGNSTSIFGEQTGWHLACGDYDDKLGQYSDLQVSASGIWAYSQATAGEDVILTLRPSGLMLFDNRALPEGFQYAATGYVTQLHSLTDKEYVDAAVAAVSAGVPDGDKGDITVSSTGTVWAIDAGAVTASKIFDGAVISTKIQSAAVTNDKIADNAVTTVKINNGAVVDSKITSVAWSKITGVPTFAGSAAGLVPASLGGTTNFLREDGTWSAPPTGSNITVSNGLTMGIDDDIKIGGPLTQTTVITTSTAGFKIEGPDAAFGKHADFFPVTDGFHMAYGDYSLKAAAYSDVYTGPFGVHLAAQSPTQENIKLDFQYDGAILHDNRSLKAGIEYADTGYVINLHSLTDKEYVDAAIAAVSSGGGITDGDKGDITVSSGGTVWNIDAAAVGTNELASSAVTTAKINNNSVTDAKINSVSWSKITSVPTFSGSSAGLVPSSLGGTTNFLRADGTWAAPAAGGADISNGTYTPTITNQSNTSTFTAYSTNYGRNGNTVTVSGRLTLTPSAADVLCAVSISLPVSSNFTSSDDCHGVADKIISNVGHSDIHGTIEANTTTDTAVIFFPSRGTNTAMTLKFVFTYRIK